MDYHAYLLPVSFTLCLEFLPGFYCTKDKVSHAGDDTNAVYCTEDRWGTQSSTAPITTDSTSLLSFSSSQLFFPSFFPRQGKTWDSHHTRVGSWETAWMILYQSWFPPSVPLEVTQPSHHMRSFMGSHQQKCGGSQFSLTDLLATEVLSFEMWSLN